MPVLRVLFLCLSSFVIATGNFVVVDTGQTKFYSTTSEISAPSVGGQFYGQDAQFERFPPLYTDNGDQTVTDQRTGLMWMKGTLATKKSYDDAVAEAETFSLAGHSDWRVPSIKELYSLIIFSGLDPSSYTGTDTSSLIPFINTTVFDFEYGSLDAGERIIDAQYLSTTKYVSTTMSNDETVFGVNFADGRIKGYPVTKKPSGEANTLFVKFVRGSTNYGVNSFQDNGDGTVTDAATGLMWMQGDSAQGMNWKSALEWAVQKNSENYLGYSDWRVPHVKELQSIVDYARSPSTTSSAAIDAIFTSTKITNEGGSDDYPFYWSGTTHANSINGNYGAYVSFGRALGFMEVPPNSGTKVVMDVHGAGAQRSDPKSGDPAAYPEGHGPQGDVIRIFNYVRLVRDAPTASSTTTSTTQATTGQGVTTTTTEIFTMAAARVTISAFGVVGFVLLVSLIGV